MKNGLGVVLDDLLAGIYVIIIFTLTIVNGVQNQTKINAYNGINMMNMLMKF